MKIYKRHLPKKISEMILSETPKNKIQSFLKEQDSTKESVLKLANSPDYICSKSQAVGSLSRKYISKEIELINSL